MSNSTAFDLALAQIASGQTREQIALAIGYSRPAVSRYLSGTYGDGVTRLEAAIIKAFDRRDCPHTGSEITPELCQKKASGPRPFGGTDRRAWWLCCQTCPNKPIQPQPKEVKA